MKFQKPVKMTITLDDGVEFYNMGPIDCGVILYVIYNKLISMHYSDGSSDIFGKL